jgi:hypothetical protein
MIWWQDVEDQTRERIMEWMMRITLLDIDQDVTLMKAFD